MAEHTRKVRLLDAPGHSEPLDIELRWIGNKDMVASARPMDDLSEDEKQKQFLERFAQHCIKSWSAGDYSPTSGLALLLKLQDADGSALNALISRSIPPEDFKIPRLVDATDLGNE